MVQDVLICLRKHQNDLGIPLGLGQRVFIRRNRSEIASYEREWRNENINIITRVTSIVKYDPEYSGVESILIKREL